MKKIRYILYVAVIALAVSTLYPVKRLDGKLWLRQCALHQVVCSVNKYGSGICTQLIDALYSYYRAKPEVLRILSMTKHNYDLVVHYGGSIAFENHLENKKNFGGRYVCVERKFLGKMLVVDVEDATVRRYLLGFENGQVVYVESNVYEALLRGEDVSCRMDVSTRCWMTVPRLYAIKRQSN